jgi:hypothetical protein
MFEQTFYLSGKTDLPGIVRQLRSIAAQPDPQKQEKAVFTEAEIRHGISLPHWMRLAAWSTINEKQGAVQLVRLEG